MSAHIEHIEDEGTIVPLCTSFEKKRVFRSWSHLSVIGSKHVSFQNLYTGPYTLDNLQATQSIMLRLQIKNKFCILEAMGFRADPLSCKNLHFCCDCKIVNILAVLRFPDSSHYSRIMNHVFKKIY